MIPATHDEIEQIYLAAESAQSRSICVTACHSGDGVTSVAAALTERFLLAGQSTLLVDLNLFHSAFEPLGLPHQTDGDEVTWLQQVENGRVFTGIIKPCSQSAIVNYRNPHYLQKMIQSWLIDFDKVVIDTSPLLQVNQGNISAQCVASACQHTLLVVLGAHTRQHHLHSAMELLNRSEADIIGCVMNSQYQPSLAQEMVRELNRLHWIPQKWRQRWSAKLLQNELLTQIA
ncbi:chromosome partitioning protein ParA [Vibrio renipiscarius]|uniref:Chromosome partitioning protein ParA n=1 Tax=Vibrio renipiscarius TaxID=1461322 RepID=A0A0C2NXX9_9VIBR|nr:chromosome partitioning protein ParA [Vibrio renipiscarius]KII79397.1 chromosome partitioning protein ParA [Vibrio renipiscarius]KII80975.1 chromosome partitioning protein ParA [Vibrio renipiscarius]